MAILEDGMRIRVTKPADFYSYDEATQPEGKLAEGTEGTVTTGEPFRGRVCIMTTDGISAWVSHHCLEQVDDLPSEAVGDVFLQPVQSPESLRTDDVHLLLNKLISPYAEVRQNAAVALTHAYSNGLLASFDAVQQAILREVVSFTPVAEVLLAQSQREMVNSLLVDLESTPAEVRDQALTDWEQLRK